MHTTTTSRPGRCLRAGRNHRTPATPEPAATSASLSRRSLLSLGRPRRRWSGRRGPRRSRRVDAVAAPLPLTPPDSVDYYDVGDSLVQFGAPTMPLVKLTVGTDGKVTLRDAAPRTGPGIATALAMMIAEEMDIPLRT